MKKLSYLLVICTLMLSSCQKDEPELKTGTLIDARDGHEYKWIEIGNQIWMAENLNYSTDSGSWIYNNNADNSETYGRLYDWTTACKVCPDGWHLPKEFEYGFLIKNIGGDSIAGRKMKEAGTEHWYNPNDRATNESGFTALPGGFRTSSDQIFQYMGYIGYWWTISKLDVELGPEGPAFCFKLYYNSGYIYRIGLDTNCGASVRCVKDK